MIFMDPDREYATEEVLEILERGELGILAHTQMRSTLVARENELVKEEMKELILENYKLGGSPDGFYYKSELFGPAAAIAKTEITQIHDSLVDQAQFLRSNRADIPQYTTYIAQFLAYMDTNISGSIEYCVNLVPGMSQFSPALKKLESHIENQPGLGDLKFFKFDREDPSRSTYFGHYDRVSRPLKRFLFRKITN